MAKPVRFELTPRPIREPGGLNTAYALLYASLVGVGTLFIFV